LIETARACLIAGLCPLPAILAEKRPDLTAWKQYHERLPTEHQLRSWFTDSQPICVLTGTVSGNLEMIAFDFAGELFPAWAKLVEAEVPGLLDRPLVERSQSGGRHVVYRCEVTIPGNLKLAQRIVPASDEQELLLCGSGSFSEEVLGAFAVELNGILECKACKVSVVYCDAEIQGEPVEWQPTDGPLTLLAMGGGGTGHGPVFDWIDESGSEPACVVCLTDCFTSYPYYIPPYPVLWAVTGNSNPRPPFGRVLSLDQPDSATLRAACPRRGRMGVTLNRFPVV